MCVAPPLKSSCLGAQALDGRAQRACEAGRFGEAHALSREALALLRRVFPPGAVQVRRVTAQRAACARRHVY